MLHVGTVDRLPVDLGEVAGRHATGVVAEPDDVDGVLGVAGGDERVQCERHALRGQPVTAQRHRARHVEQQHGGGRSALLGLFDLEVVRVEPDAIGRWPGPEHGIGDGLAKVEPEGVAMAPGPRLAGGLVADHRDESTSWEPCCSEREPLEHPGQRPLAQLPDTTGGELQTPTGAHDHTRVLEHLLDLTEPPQVSHGVVTQCGSQRVLVDVLEGCTWIVLTERLFELVEPARLVDGVEAFGQPHWLPAHVHAIGPTATSGPGPAGWRRAGSSGRRDPCPASSRP